MPRHARTGSRGRMRWCWRSSSGIPAARPPSSPSPWLPSVDSVELARSPGTGWPDPSGVKCVRRTAAGNQTDGSGPDRGGHGRTRHRTCRGRARHLHVPDRATRSEGRLRGLRRDRTPEPRCLELRGVQPPAVATCCAEIGVRNRASARENGTDLPRRSKSDGPRGSSLAIRGPEPDGGPLDQPAAGRVQPLRRPATSARGGKHP
jgi:hypothetical protein